jgi:hypothetical protein
LDYPAGSSSYDQYVQLNFKTPAFISVLNYIDYSIPIPADLTEYTEINSIKVHIGVLTWGIIENKLRIVEGSSVTQGPVAYNPTNTIRYQWSITESDSSDVNDIINSGSIDFRFSTVTSGTATSRIIYIYYIYASVSYTPKQKTDLAYEYSFNIFDDDDYTDQDINLDYIRNLYIYVEIDILPQGTSTSPSFASVYLMEGKFPYGKSTLGSGLLTGTNFLIKTITLTQNPQKYFASDGTLTIRIEMGYNLAQRPALWNIDSRIDYISVKVQPLAISFPQISTNDYSGIKIRSKGSFNIYNGYDNGLIGSPNSVSYTVHSYSLPASIPLSSLYFTTTSAPDYIDWITFVESPSVDNPIRDIDTGSSTADLYSGDYYSDNEVPLDLTQTSSSLSLKAYFCAEHDYEYARMYRSASLSSKGISQNNALEITYQTTASGTNPEKPKIGLRSSITGDTYYKELEFSPSSTTTITIPLNQFNLDDTFNRLEILMRDRGTNAGTNSVDTFEIEITQLDLISIPIPDVQITNPTDGEVIVGFFDIEGTVTHDSNIQTFNIFIDNSLIYSTVPATTSYSFNISINNLTLGEGTHIIKVNATDSDSIEGYQIIGIIVDNWEDPTIEILGSIRRVLYDQINVSTIVSVDSTSSVDSVVFSINDTIISTLTSEPYTIDLYAGDYDEGEYILYATVYDDYDQNATDKISLLIDETPPPIVEFVGFNRTLIIWDEPYYTIDPNITVLTGNLTFVEFYINGRLIDTDHYRDINGDQIQHTYYFSGIANGTIFEIEIYAYDDANQSNWNNFTMTYYTTQPSTNDILTIIINFIDWLINWIVSGFGILFSAIIGAGTTLVSATKWNKKGLTAFMGGSVLGSGVLTTIFMNPAFGLLTGLFSFLVSGIGAVSGTGIRKIFLSDKKKQECTKNPKKMSCRLMLSDNDLENIGKNVGNRPKRKNHNKQNGCSFELASRPKTNKRHSINCNLDIDPELIFKAKRKD